MYKKGRMNSNSRIISTDEDASLRIESSAIINLRGVSTKLKKYIIWFCLLGHPVCSAALTLPTRKKYTYHTTQVYYFPLQWQDQSQPT